MIFSCSSNSSASFKNMLITFYLSKKVGLIVGYLRKTDGRTVRVPLCIRSSPTSPFCAEVAPHSRLSPRGSWVWAGLIQSAKAAEIMWKEQHGAFCTQHQPGVGWKMKEQGKGWMGGGLAGRLCLHCLGSELSREMPLQCWWMDLVWTWVGWERENGTVHYNFE